ncbi:unnamed protein product [Cunninghamella blakesleeana]
MVNEADIAIALIKDTIKVTNQLVKDYADAFPNANTLSPQCKSIETILNQIQGIGSLPFKEQIGDTIYKINTTNKLIITFIDKRKEYKSSRSIVKKPYYFVKLIYNSWDFNQEFQKWTQQLDIAVNNIEKSLKITQEICDNEIHSNKTSWPLFASRYQQKYDTIWSAGLKLRIKPAALVEDDVLNLFGFLELSTKYGFPIDYNRLPKLTGCSIHYSISERSLISNTLTNFIDICYSKEMQECILSVIKLYNTRKQVNIARIKVVSFYEKFALQIQIELLSKEIFQGVDYLSQGEIINFIDYFEPLDFAHYHIIGEGSHWDTKKPKIYQILDDFFC